MQWENVFFLRIYCLIKSYVRGLCDSQSYRKKSLENIIIQNLTDLGLTSKSIETLSIHKNKGANGFARFLENQNPGGLISLLLMDDKLFGKTASI